MPFGFTITNFDPLEFSSIFNALKSIASCGRSNEWKCDFETTESMEMNLVPSIFD